MAASDVKPYLDFRALGLAILLAGDPERSAPYLPEGGDEPRGRAAHRSVSIIGLVVASMRPPASPARAVRALAPATNHHDFSASINASADRGQPGVAELSEVVDAGCPNSRRTPGLWGPEARCALSCYLVVRPEGIEPPTFGFVVGGRLIAGPPGSRVLARNHAVCLRIVRLVAGDTGVVGRQARTQDHRARQIIQRKIAQALPASVSSFPRRTSHDREPHREPSYGMESVRDEEVRMVTDSRRFGDGGG